jgi:hypothetical protein
VRGGECPLPRSARLGVVDSMLIAPADDESGEKMRVASRR